VNKDPLGAYSRTKYTFLLSSKYWSIRRTWAWWSFFWIL